MRSPTAELVYRNLGYKTRSAGTEYGARKPVSNELIEWADLVFVMEARQKVIIASMFCDVAHKKDVVVLGIPDKYLYMESELVDILIEKVTPYL